MQSVRVQDLKKIAAATAPPLDATMESCSTARLHTRQKM
jgi:hypothetical protein